MRWVQLVPFQIQRDVAGPPARQNHAMATLNGTVVLFGGCSVSDPDEPGGITCSSPLSDTLTWDGMGWTQQDVVGPSARVGHAMASLDGTVLLFGGAPAVVVSHFDLGDTWTWNATSWTQRSVSGAPVRENHAMAALNGTVVLFGGGSSAYFAPDPNTWTWDGTTWSRHVPSPPYVTSPGERWSLAAATLDGNVVLFGGYLLAPLGDTWTWDGASWTQQNVVGPSARFEFAMAAW